MTAWTVIDSVFSAFEDQPSQGEVLSREEVYLEVLTYPILRHSTVWPIRLTGRHGKHHECVWWTKPFRHQQNLLFFDHILLSACRERCMHSCFWRVCLSRGKLRSSINWNQAVRWVGHLDYVPESTPQWFPSANLSQFYRDHYKQQVQTLRSYKQSKAFISVPQHACCLILWSKHTTSLKSFKFNPVFFPSFTDLHYVEARRRPELLSRILGRPLMNCSEEAYCESYSLNWMNCQVKQMRFDSIIPVTVHRRTTSEPLAPKPISSQASLHRLFAIHNDPSKRIAF